MGVGSSAEWNNMCKDADIFKNLKAVFTFDLFRNTLTHFSEHKSKWQQWKPDTRVCN